MTAAVRSCLVVSVAVLTVAGLAGVPGEPAEFLAAGPDGVTGGVESRSDEAVSLRAARESGQPVRVESLTSATTEVYALPTGQFRADIAAGVQRFRRDGKWVRVDLTLQARPDGSVRPVAHPNDLWISGAKGAGEQDLAVVGAGESRVVMGWSGALPTPVLEANRATYPDARPGVDLVVEATRLGFEQFLVVKNRAALIHVDEVDYVFSGSGVESSSRGVDGSVLLRDRAGEQRARIPAPLMWDARKDIVGSPVNEKRVRTDVVDRGGRVELTLAPDMGWLRSAATEYPVTIDPTVNPLGTTFDTYVRETVTSDQNQRSDLQVGLLATTPTELTRSFLTWDTTVLVGKQITASTVSFWNWWSDTCTPTPWEIWTTGTSTYTTTFTNQPEWFTKEATSTETHGSFDCSDAWATIDGKSFFQRAATANKTRAGMGIRATDETDTSGFKQFRSREGANPSQDPKASVTYNSWPTMESRSTVPATSCVTGSDRPLVDTLTPQFKATVSDGDGTAMTVTFEWWAMNVDRPVGSVSFNNVASGATAATTVPAGDFVDGGIYRWRVKAADGVSGSDVWSSFCEMQVYTTDAPVTGCVGGTDSDFNGDGIADIAIADPEAAVEGQEKAGHIRVVYGGGTVETLHEGNSQVSGAVGAGDQFGYSVSAYDANNDGCTDLAVGVPFEDLTATDDAGVTYVLLGTPNGLAQGPASLTFHQGAGDTPDQAEVDDHFGFAVAGARSLTGEPYLVVGTPGEDVGDTVDAGVAHYFRGNLNVLFQSGELIPGVVEQDDRVGYAVAASSNHFAIGSPGEAIGPEAFAGAVCVFSSYELVEGKPKLAVNFHQSAANVSDVAEANDLFGKSISIAPYRPAGAAADQADSLLVVGVPGEDITVEESNTVVADAGLVHRFHVTGDATRTELPALTYALEEGAYLGEEVAVVNTEPASDDTNDTMFLAVGAPGADTDDLLDAGRVLVFPALADPIGTPTTIHREAASLPGSAVTQELIGASLGAISQQLYVGTPYRDPAVYGFAWSSLAAGAASPSTTWQPGQGGIPAGGTAFGAAIG
ncbi:DNRLRE domain-containing protein [Salinispora cortesiana]|uniref:DNRLRE domain-containing protein n=1 Tax=Salinispora cortesiana TaxID=1305843 RepID=UPI001FE06073|nr:DNRLRE domain-containing protein [Salinispora cortesiana]